MVEKLQLAELLTLSCSCWPCPLLLDKSTPFAVQAQLPQTNRETFHVTQSALHLVMYRRHCTAGAL